MTRKFRVRANGRGRVFLLLGIGAINPVSLSPRMEILMGMMMIRMSPCAVMMVEIAGSHGIDEMARGTGLSQRGILLLVLLGNRPSRPAQASL
jgi:hypothetical protein